MIDITELIEIISNNTTGIDAKKLDCDISLQEQGLDSLDIISILFVIEERKQIKFLEEDIDRGKLSTLNLILNYVNNQHMQ